MGVAEGSKRPGPSNHNVADVIPSTPSEAPRVDKSADTRVIDFELQLTPDEVLDCWHWHSFAGPGAPSPRSVGIRFEGWEPSVLLVMTAAYLFWLWYLAEEVGRFSVGPALILGVCVVLWWIRIVRRRRRLSPEKSFADEHREKAGDAARQIEQGWRVRIDADGVVYANEHGVSLVRWRGVSLFARSGRIVVLHTVRNQDLFLPIRLLAKGAADDQACETLRTWMMADGGGQEHFVPRYLQDRDVPCMKCKYNLRGVTSLACPECGLSLDLRTLPGAFAAPPNGAVQGESPERNRASS